MRWRGLLLSLLWISPARSEPWPSRQRSDCILKLWLVPKKWLINLTNFYHFLLTTGMYFTYSHLYSERRDVLSVFPIKKKTLWAAFCCDVRKNRLWIPLQKHHRKHAGGEDECVTEIHEWSPPRTPHSSLFWKYNVWDPQTLSHLFLQSCGFHTG